MMLAEFYLAHRSDELVWFDEPNKFYIALGGDGAPFGKYDTACMCLVGDSRMPNSSGAGR